MSERNTWEEFLSEAKTGDTNSSIPQSTLFVVGNPQNGKSSILKSWGDRVTSDTDIPEYILDFSYCNVIDRYDPDTADDALVSRMGIWQLDDDAHAKLLPTLTKDPTRVGFIITLDLSEPGTLLETFDKWLKVYKDTCTGLIQGGSEQETALKLKISKYVQTFVDATKKTEKVEIKIVEEVYDPEADKNKDKDGDGDGEAGDTAAGDAEGGDKDGDGEAKEDEKKEEPEEDEIILEAPIDPEIPVNNFGVPLFVVGCKADFFEKKLNQIGANDKFDFMTNQLRKKCLNWGATLIYTSAVGDGVNANLMVDQVYHRLFDFPLLHKPKLVGSSTDYSIHAPAGYDKLMLIELSRAKWDASTKLSVVFGEASDKKSKEGKRGGSIAAKSDLEFFKSLKEQLESGKRRPDPKETRSANKKKKEKAVKSFFKSLLSKE